MDVTAFIRELLFGHDCVIVPGFGGFICNYTPAHIDKNSGTFFPPVKQISFNRNLNHNDGLLIGRISGTSGMTYGDSRDLIENFVADIRRKLEKGEKINFDLIGSFTLNQEGNIQFEPDKSANYHLDSYGLEPFHCMPLEGYDVRKRILRNPGTERSRHIPLRKVLWRAAVIIPLLTLMITVPLKTDLFRAKVETSTLNPLAIAEFEHNKQAVDEVETNLAEVITKTISNEDPAMTQTVSLPEPEVEVSITQPAAPASSITSPVYFLITGSFKTEENAYQQVKILENEGFTPEVISASNGFYRVSAMTCPDLETAKMRKDSLEKKFSGVWISRKR